MFILKFEILLVVFVNISENFEDTLSFLCFFLLVECKKKDLLFIILLKNTIFNQKWFWKLKLLLRWVKTLSLLFAVILFHLWNNEELFRIKSIKWIDIELVKLIIVRWNVKSFVVLEKTSEVVKRCSFFGFWLV
jgi:hypothetical protein